MEVHGKTVTKGTVSTDDLFRCMILAHAALHDEKVLEQMVDDVAEPEPLTSDAPPAMFFPSSTQGGAGTNDFGYVGSASSNIV